MIHVLHVLGGLTGIGGTPRKLLSLVRYADRSAIAHTFLCTETGDLAAAFEEQGATVEIIGSYAPVAICCAVARTAARVSANVIATHFTRQLVCGALVARALRIPFIHHEHGPSIEGMGDSSIEARLGGILKRRLVANARAIVCNSHYTARTVRDAYGLASSRLRVVHNPVERRQRGDASPLRPFESAALRLGHIGGLIWQRDQETLIRAVALARSRGHDVTLSVIGDGPLRQKLLTLVASLQLEDAVQFHGYQSDLSRFFDSIDLYVNPAVAEGFGIAVVEAMLEGLPVLLCDSGAHPELVSHLDSGVLFAPGDVSSLAEWVVTLAADPQMRMQLGQRGRLHAQRAFRPQLYAQAYESIVREVLHISPASQVRTSAALPARVESDATVR